LRKFITIVILISIISLGSCSTRKDNFLSRSFHNVTTKYNVLYNGNVALDKGKTELSKNYEDNYWEILPIEPMEINEDELLLAENKDEKSNQSNFDIAEEKAVKAVQKHGMYIAGSEKNKQIDDAYLLLGKARYYSQRFVPAFEAFDYSLKNNKNSDQNVLLHIWRAKTRLRMQNENLAFNELSFVLKNPNIQKSDKEQAHTALAMTYFAMDSIPSTIKQLLKATDTDENKEQHARNLFILGQLYASQKNIDSSRWAFNEVINYKKSPKKYKVHAYLQQIKNLNDSIELTEIKKKLNKILKDPINKSYFDVIYYSLAEIDFKKNNSKEALENLHKSIHVPTAKKYQKVLSYEKIGDYYFNNTDFVTAAKYYDSIEPYVENKNTKHNKKLIRKIKNLEELVLYETQLKRNDSILNLVSMNDADKKTYFEQYISKIKKADEIIAIQKENEERAKIIGETASPKVNDKEMSKGKWYFYNTQTVTYGKDEFVKNWGKRELKDNWRWSETKHSFEDNEKSNIATNNNDKKTKKENQKYEVDFYLNAIPKDSETITNLQNENSNACYQLGLIYKEKFHVYPLAAEKLERFLAEKPKENLILPAKFHMVKIYENLGNPKMAALKNEILSQHPNSRYAQMLESKKINIANDSIITPEKHYEKVYCDYEYEYYDSVLNQCEIAIKQYEDEPILPKFELLKSYALYHVQGKPQFIEGLEFVIANFPKTEEALHAQEVLDRWNGIVKPQVIDNEIFNKEEPIINSIENKENKNFLNEDEKKQKVLEMIKNQGPPPPNINNKDRKEN